MKMNENDCVVARMKMLQRPPPPFDNVMDLLKRHVSYVLGTEQSRTD